MHIEATAFEPVVLQPGKKRPATPAHLPLPHPRHIHACPFSNHLSTPSPDFAYIKSTRVASFLFGPQPWTHIEATALEPVVLQPGESRSAFVQRVQEAIALELGAYVVPGLTIQQKRAMASDKSKDGRLRSGGKLC